MKKVVLAYSGGLDTSVILKWLQEEKNLEVITYTADLGQGDISDDLEEKAKSLGASKVIVDDLTEEFISDPFFPTIIIEYSHPRWLWVPMCRDSKNLPWLSPRITSLKRLCVFLNIAAFSLAFLKKLRICS